MGGMQCLRGLSQADAVTDLPLQDGPDTTLVSANGRHYMINDKGLLGKGAFGSVYLTADAATKQQKALKTVDMSDDHPVSLLTDSH